MTAIVIKMAPIVNRLWAIRHAATTEALVTIPASGKQTEYDQAHSIQFAKCERQASERIFKIQTREQAEERERQ